MTLCRRRGLGAPVLALCCAFLAQPQEALPQSTGEARIIPPDPAERPSSSAYIHDTMAPRARAVRTTGPITLDGRLDEPVWRTAPAITEFLQSIPNEGERVSEETEVRILYDDEHIYVGAWLWDEGEVQDRMSRKDGTVPDADFFVVLFDSYHDHRTAFRFGTWPSGVKKDQIIIAGGGLQDTSWDPVWDLDTTITDEGWFAEMRIPFSQLRYGAGDGLQNWGFQAERRLRRKGEDVEWAFTPRSEPGGVARYGHLDGIEGISQGRRLELLPFVTARAEYLQVPRSEAAPFANPFRSGSDYFGNAGLDLKYRVGTNLTLDATVNPDFGQVEVDPAVINLTAFETRFEEKRPFFVEGAEIFRFGDLGGRPGGAEAQLVYSRRIGRTPQGSVPDEAEYSDIPGSTTILGAVKLSGKLAGGWSVGVLDAVTDRIRAPWTDTEGRNQSTEVEPLTNYLAARLRRDIRQGTGSFGLLATSVNRDLGTQALAGRLRSSAYSLGVDGRLEWDSQRWMLAGKLSGSRLAGSSEAIIRAQRSSARYMDRPDGDHLDYDPEATSLTGIYGKLDLLKQSGAWQGGVGMTAISPGYEVNDLGFQTWADRVDLTSSFGYEQPTAGEHFRTLSVTGGSTGTFNFGGEAVFAEASLALRAQHVSFNTLNLRVARQFRAWDDRLTRGGPLTRQPAGYSGRIQAETDRRKPWQVSAAVDFAEDSADGRSRRAEVGLGFRFLEIVEVQVVPSLTRTRTAAQYVTTVSDDSAAQTFGERYVFAPLDQTTLAVESRFNVTFTPDLSFELYAQPFVSGGEYGDLMELRSPRTFDFLIYGRDKGVVTRGNEGVRTIDPDGTGTRSFQIDPLDFSFRSLLGNAVLRWEWRPGSTLFLVWQQVRSEELLDIASPETAGRIGAVRLGPDTRALFGLEPDNLFMLKVTYWLNP